MKAAVIRTTGIADIDTLKEAFPIQSELTDYLIMKLMEGRGEPGGCMALKLELDELNYITSSATIGRSQKIMDSHGYTYQVANKGRMLTDMGIQKIEHLDHELTERQLSRDIIVTSKAKSDSISELLDLMQARKIIECQAVRFAAEKATEDDLREIKWALDQHRKIVDRKLSTAGAGLDFHIMVVHAAKNKFMGAIVRLLTFEERNLEFETAQLSTFAHAAAYVDVHQAIFDALTEKDADKAEKLMCEHFEDMINVLTQDLSAAE